MSEVETNTQVEEPVVDTLSNVEVTDNGSSMSVSANVAPEVDPMDNQALEVPEKFRNEDPAVQMQNILKSYSEMEKKFSQGGTKDEQPVQTDATEQVGEGDSNHVADLVPTTSDDTTTDNSQDNGVDVSEFSKLWDSQGGKLTDEQWADASSKHGVTVEEAKQFAQWKQGQVDGAVQQVLTQSDQAIFDAVGGSEKYNEMEKWASETLSSTETASLEVMLSNPDLAVKGAQVLQSMYNNRGTIEPSAPLDAHGAPVSYDGFTSELELQEAQSNPLYKTSEKYRRQWKEKATIYMRKTGQLR